MCRWIQPFYEIAFDITSNSSNGNRILIIKKIIGSTYVGVRVNKTIATPTENARLNLL